ncbi:MAG TPA: DUF1697 domain-containing protein [Propionibacteriaceae bacterium]
MADPSVALLRGVNVGRANRVAMADLRALLTDLGCTDVRTLLNSGNAVFVAPAEMVPAYIADRIREALAARLSVRASVIVVGAVDLAVAIAQNPLLDLASDPARLLVAFLAEPHDRSRLTAMAEQDWAPESFAVGEHVAYLWCPGGIAGSRLSRALGQALGDSATARNWTTVIKLRALAEDVSRSAPVIERTEP